MAKRDAEVAPTPGVSGESNGLRGLVGLIAPEKFLKTAIAAVPAVRYALGVGGVASVIPIVLSGFGLDAKTAIVGTLVVFVFMVVLVVFSVLVNSIAALKIPAIVLCWAFLMLAIVSAVLMTSSFFFDYPKPMECLFDRTCAGGAKGDPKISLERQQITTLSKQLASELPEVDLLKAVDSLRAYVRNLAAGPDKEYGVAELKRAFLREKSRIVRRAIIEAIKVVRDGDMSRDFKGGELAKTDVVHADLRQANLSGVSFRDAFLIQTDLSGASLESAVFAGANMRNVRLSGANLQGVDFTRADWFNAVGLTGEQLRRARGETLLACPTGSGGRYTEQGFRRYLPDKYGYPFESWDPDIQNELRKAWAVYSRAGGLCEAIKDLPR